MENLNDKEELKQMAPTLLGIEKKEPFEAPQGYFDSFPLQLQMQLKAKTKKQSAVLSFLLRWKYALSMGCAGLLIALAWIFSAPETSSAGFNNVAVNTEINITEEVLETFNEEELVAVLSEENPELSSSEDNDLEEYILENYSAEEMIIE